jgi:hypothetical protein
MAMAIINKMRNISPVLSIRPSPAKAGGERPSKTKD